jgi:hypothetical protein
LSKIWRLREKTARPLIDLIPIEKRIEWIILSLLRDKGGEASPDDIFSAIFTILRNDLTPENEEILTVLRKIAKPVKNDKGRPRWRLVSPLEELETYYKEPTEIESSALEDHDYILKVMSSIGIEFDFDVWIGDVETSRNKELLKYKTLKDLQISGIDNVTLERLKNVDVIWLMRKTIPFALIEVEHTTDFRSGILRVSNIIDVLPHINVRLCIVLPDERLKSFKENVLKEHSIRRLLSGRVLYYITYSELASILDEIRKYNLGKDDFFRMCREEHF